MNIRPVIPVGPGSFTYGMERVGALCLRILAREDAEELARVVRGYRFTERPEQYGPRGVVQRFSACEEEDIPKDSAVRTLSQNLTSLVEEMFGGRTRSAGPLNAVFETPFCLNDHLLLRYPPTGVGLGAHRDHSKYINLIVSLTLAGEARFNLHDGPNGPPVKTFRASPGVAVFMRGSGLLGEDIRPHHSVTGVSEERITLILKQKRG